MDFDIKSIKEMMDGLDPKALLPEVSSIVDTVTVVCRLAILVGPIVLLIMGLSYLLLSPKEANHYLGYRTVFGMGSVSAWRHTQKVAGFLFGGLGLVLTVIMLMVSMSLGGSDPMATVWTAVKCLIWQTVLALIAVISVNSIAALTFDYHGNRRRK